MTRLQTPRLRQGWLWESGFPSTATQGIEKRFSVVGEELWAQHAFSWAWQDSRVQPFLGWMVVTHRPLKAVPQRSVPYSLPIAFLAPDARSIQPQAHQAPTTSTSLTPTSSGSSDQRGQNQILRARFRQAPQPAPAEPGVGGSRRSPHPGGPTCHTFSPSLGWRYELSSLSETPANLPCSVSTALLPPDPKYTRVLFLRAGAHHQPVRTLKGTAKKHRSSPDATVLVTGRGLSPHMQRLERNRGRPTRPKNPSAPGGRGHGGAAYQVPDAEDDGAGADMAAEAAAVGIETRPGRVQHLRGSQGSALRASRRAAPRGRCWAGPEPPLPAGGTRGSGCGRGLGRSRSGQAAPGGSSEEPASFPLTLYVIFWHLFWLPTKPRNVSSKYNPGKYPDCALYGCFGALLYYTRISAPNMTPR